MNRRAVLLVAAVVLAAAAYGAWWLLLARGLEAGIAAWIEARRNEGWRIEHGKIAIGGFPFRLIAEVADPAIEAPDWSWSGPVWRAVVKPWDHAHVFAMAEGTQKFGLRFGDERIEATLDGDKLLASLRHSQGVVRRVDVDLSKPIFDSAALRGRYAAERLEIHFRRNAGEAADRPAGTRDLALDTKDAILPQGLGGPLGNLLGTARLRARLAGEIGTGKDALIAWREAGGTVELEELSVAWGPLEARLNATLALDRQNRPLGAGTLRARGHEKTIDAVEGAKLLRPIEAQMLRLAFAAMAKRDADPRPFVELPATAQDGRLSIGPVPVLRFGPLF